MRGQRPKILVVGSCAMDLITATEILPKEGETVVGSSFTTAPGGKGGNQAVQAARLGAEVTMVGKVGADQFGDTLLASLKAAGVDTRYVLRAEAVSTGIANIVLVQEHGKTRNNRITIVPGANGDLRVQEVDFLKDGIAGYDMVLLQNELPAAVNACVARYAKAAGIPVMLNPAPTRPLSRELLSHITYLSPNEHEAADLTGISLNPGACIVDQARPLMAALHGLGAAKVLVTLGAWGAMQSDGTATNYQPCVPEVEAIDPTAAGDSFVAAFCVGLCLGLAANRALCFANHTAALTVSALGAQPSLPAGRDVSRGRLRADCAHCLRPGHEGGVSDHAVCGADGGAVLRQGGCHLLCHGHYRGAQAERGLHHSVFQ